MAVLAAIVVGVLTALSYSRKGLFAAAVLFISILLAATTALAFGATVVHVIDYQSPYAYSATLFALALFCFMIIRGALAFIEEEVDFHPAVERLGGALLGLAVGLVGVGFLCVCLACMPLPALLEGTRPNTQQAAAMILLPSDTARKVVPGQQPFTLGALLASGGQAYSAYTPPSPPPPIDTQSTSPTRTTTGAP